MVGVLTSGVVDRRFESRSGQTRLWNWCCCFSAISTRHEGIRANIGLLRIRSMYPSQATCLSTRGLLFQCASTIKYQTQLVGLVQSEPHHLIKNVTCYRYIIAENRSLAVKQQSFTSLECVSCILHWKW